MSIKKTPPRTSERGFSLIELLLVMTLVPILFFAVFTNFTTGLKIWTRVAASVPEEDLAIFHLKVSRELEGMQRFSPIPFEGGEEEVSFAAAIQTVPELGGDRAIGRVRLYYDAGKKLIIRQTQNYSEFCREETGRESVLLQHVRSFSLSYLAQDPLQSGYAWNEFWKPEHGKLPNAVKIVYSVESVPGDQECVVFIPVGGMIK